MIVANEQQIAERRDLAMVRMRLRVRAGREHATAANFDVLQWVADIDLVNFELRALEHIVVLRGAVQLLVDDKPVVLGDKTAAVLQVVAEHACAAATHRTVQAQPIKTGRVVERGGAHGVEHLRVQRVGNIQAGDAVRAFHRGQHQVIAHREDGADAEPPKLTGRHGVGLAGAAIRKHRIRRVMRVDDVQAVVR